MVSNHLRNDECKNVFCSAIQTAHNLNLSIAILNKEFIQTLSYSLHNNLKIIDLSDTKSVKIMITKIKLLSKAWDLVSSWLCQVLSRKASIVNFGIRSCLFPQNILDFKDFFKCLKILSLLLICTLNLHFKYGRLKVSRRLEKVRQRGLQKQKL